MKKFVLLLTVISVLASAAPSIAADITVGASTWYSWWDFEPKDSPDKFEYDPAFLYGPVLAVKLNDDFSLNFVFLYGEFDGDYKVYYSGWQSFPSKTKRYDSDTSISYRLNSYIKLFGGFKYVAYKFSVDAVPFYALPDIEVENIAYGPAAGLSFVLPLVDNFFLLANVSGMYLWGKSKNSATETTDGGGWGYNTTASVAYYIPAASMTLSLGGRYQFIRWETESNNGTASDHKFYGITASATYSFTL